MKKPIVFDLYCGLGGWTEGFLLEGYDAIGFDIERHDYGSGGYPGQLVIQDALTIDGRRLKDATVIVASPPCQEYSYMAMPWSRGKAIAAEYRSGKRDVKELTALFDACFRIQREAIEAAGHFIPLIVENVRGACPWVGRSRWNYGSFHLWGDVPALMPNTAKFKSSGMNWSDRTLRGQDFTRIAGAQNGIKVAGNNGPRRWSDREVQRLCDSVKGIPHKPTGHRTNPAENGTKQGGDWFNASQPSISRRCSSKSKARKAASAAIAKIPLPLSRWIAKVYKNAA